MGLRKIFNNLHENAFPIKGVTVSLSTEEYLREICKKQERIISRLELLCWLTAGITLALLGARWGWWPL